MPKHAAGSRRDDKPPCQPESIDKEAKAVFESLKEGANGFQQAASEFQHVVGMQHHLNQVISGWVANHGVHNTKIQVSAEKVYQMLRCIQCIQQEL